MALKFFRIPVEGSPLMEAELNAFLSGHKVLRVTREPVERESSPGWAVCVEYMAGAGVAAATGGRGACGRGALQPPGAELACVAGVRFPG